MPSPAPASAPAADRKEHPRSRIGRRRKHPGATPAGILEAARAFSAGVDELRKTRQRQAEREEEAAERAEEELKKISAAAATGSRLGRSAVAPTAVAPKRGADIDGEVALDELFRSETSRA